MEGEDKGGNIMRMLEVGAACGLGWTGVSAHSGDRFRSIIDESEWQKVSGKARRWAVSACHVTLIDTALLRWHRHPFVRRLLFQFVLWFIYRDTRLNNHWSGSGLSCGLCSVVPSKKLGCLHWRRPGKGDGSCCERCSVHVPTHL